MINSHNNDSKQIHNLLGNAEPFICAIFKILTQSCLQFVYPIEKLANANQRKTAGSEGFLVYIDIP